MIIVSEISKARLLTGKASYDILVSKQLPNEYHEWIHEILLIYNINIIRIHNYIAYIYVVYWRIS